MLYQRFLTPGTHPLGPIPWDPSPGTLPLGPIPWDPQGPMRPGPQCPPWDPQGPMGPVQTPTTILDGIRTRYQDCPILQFISYQFLQVLNAKVASKQVFQTKIQLLYDFISKNSKKNRNFILLRGSFQTILAIQNQFSGIEKSKFYENLQKIFLIKKSICLYKNRFLDLKKPEKTRKNQEKM